MHHIQAIDNVARSYGVITKRVNGRIFLLDVDYDFANASEQTQWVDVTHMSLTEVMQWLLEH